MCVNHALAGKIWYVCELRSFSEKGYVRKLRSFGQNMVCAQITLFRAKYSIENLGWHEVKIIIPPWAKPTCFYHRTECGNMSRAFCFILLPIENIGRPNVLPKKEPTIKPVNIGTMSRIRTQGSRYSVQQSYTGDLFKRRVQYEHILGSK